MTAEVGTGHVEFETPLASAADSDIPVCATNSDEAIAIIREQRPRWAETQKALKAPA